MKTLFIHSACLKPFSVLILHLTFVFSCETTKLTFTSIIHIWPSFDNWNRIQWNQPYYSCHSTKISIPQSTSSTKYLCCYIYNLTNKMIPLTYSNLNLNMICKLKWMDLGMVDSLYILSWDPHHHFQFFEKNLKDTHLLHIFQCHMLSTHQTQFINSSAVSSH